MFSVREHAEYEDQAWEQVWRAIQEKAELQRQSLGARELRLETLTYSSDRFISVIEELPDDPKAPGVEQLRVAIEVEAAFRVIR